MKLLDKGAQTLSPAFGYRQLHEKSDFLGGSQCTHRPRCRFIHIYVCP